MEILLYRLCPLKDLEQCKKLLDGITDSIDMFEWTLGVGDRQGGLACCSPWDRKELDMTE